MYGKKVDRFYNQLTPLRIIKKQSNPSIWKEILPSKFFEKQNDWLLFDLKNELIIQIFEKFQSQKQNKDTLDNLSNEIFNKMLKLNNEGLIYLPSNFFPILKKSLNDPSNIEIYFQLKEELYSCEKGLLKLLNRF
jgi:hypothetical protein